MSKTQTLAGYRRVWNEIHSKGTHGANCDEIAVALDMMVHSVSGCFTWLRAVGAIERAGKRPTRTGRKAWVCVAIGDSY